MLNKTGKSSQSIGPATKDRRADPRYKFAAPAQVVEKTSGLQIESRVRDLGPRGGFLDTDSPFPVGTIVTVRITKGVELFEAGARVVSSSVGKGMGLFFTTVNPAHSETLAEWLMSALETSWLTSMRRRSQRIQLRLPIRVTGKDISGSPFTEQTHTQTVSAHGALIFLSASVCRGQHLTLLNEGPRESLECVVAHIGAVQEKHGQVGLAFILPNPTFWNVIFPPEDWSVHHPDAKSKPGVRSKRDE